MNLRNYGSRMPILLRLAPWADLELIRERITERLLQIHDLQDYYSVGAKKKIMEFSKGERHHVPASIRATRALEQILLDQYPELQRQYDRRFSAARSELHNYFFASDDYLGINP